MTWTSSTPSFFNVTLEVYSIVNSGISNGLGYVTAVQQREGQWGGACVMYTSLASSLPSALDCGGKLSSTSLQYWGQVSK